MFQDGGSYLHDVSKNGTTDEGNAFCSRRKYLQLSLPTVPFLWSNNADCPALTVLQVGGSYLHDVSKNCTTDEDHVFPPRRILDADLELGEPLHVTLIIEKKYSHH